MRRRYRNSNLPFVFGVFAGLLCVMTVGYAAFSTNLNINVKGNLKKMNAARYLQTKVVTTGDGLYKDTYENGRYIFKGGNPDNYITFNDETWRILSVENDGTLKIIRNESICTKKFDSTGLRDTNSSIGGTYCTSRSGYGCNAWGVSNSFINDNISGTVLKDAELNIYLNGTYFNELDIDAQEHIVARIFNIGGTSKDQTNLATTISNEKAYKWTGNIALPTVSEYVRASKNSECASVNAYYYMINQGCSNNNLNHNWMYKILTDEGLKNGWLLSPLYFGKLSSRLFYVYMDGSLGNGDANWNEGFASQNMSNVVPALYLTSDIKLLGEGTEDKPYTIVP